MSKSKKTTSASEPQNPLAAQIVNQVILNVSDILPNNWNGSRAPDAELVASIAEKGVLQPVMVRAVEGGYQIVCGSRRLAAAKKAGRDTIPALIAALDDAEAREVMLTENIQREGMSPLEESAAILALLESKPVAEVSKAIGKSRAYVAHCREIGRLTEKAAKWLNKYVADVPRETLVILAQIEGPKQAAFLEEHFRYNVAELYEPAAVQMHFLRDKKPLGKDCPFDQDSDSLLPGVCACTACPNRTGKDPDLFGALGKEDYCADRECYSRKYDAYVGAIMDAAAIKHPKAQAYFIGYPDPTMQALLKERGAVQIKQWGECIWEKCKKADKGATLFICLFPEAQTGKTAYYRKQSVSRAEFNEAHPEQPKPGGRAVGDEMVTRRRLAWIAEQITSKVEKGICAEKWRTAEAMIELVSMYGADPFGREAYGMPAPDKALPNGEALPLTVAVFQQMRREIITRNLTFRTVSDIDPKKFTQQLKTVLDYVEAYPEDAWESLRIAAEAQIKSPKAKK